MQLILAIDSDPRRSEQLATLVRARLQVDLVQATSAGEGLHALKDQVPDLILTSPLLSPFDEGVLDEYLRDLGSAATHVQTVRIPMLSSGPRKKSAAKRLFSLGRKPTPTSSAAPDGCDPKVFADEIAHYLTRSLEERPALAKATADKSFSTQATADRFASAKAAPARTREIVSEPIVQQFEEWTAPEVLVDQFRTPAPAAAVAKASAPKAEPGVELTHVPGSILDLRMPIVHAPEPAVVAEPEPVVHAFVEREPITFVRADPRFDLAQASPFDVTQDRPVFVESEAPSYVEPESIAYVEPEPIAYVQPESVAYLEPEPFDLAQGRPPAYVEAAVPVIETLESRSVIATPASTTTTPASGNSASFEAALAAIRAAWATPEPTTPASSQPGSPVGGATPLAGSGEIDLTNDIDAFEGVTAADGAAPPAADDSSDHSTTPHARRKVEKVGKGPEKPRGRKTRGPDGRDEWSVFDPNQYEFSALVDKLDEVTDSDEVTTPATNNR